MSKRNPNNSTGIQYLLDLQTSAKLKNNDVIATLAYSLEKELKANVSITSDADKLFTKHKYPNNKIHYAKVETTNDIERYLSGNACKLKDIACKYMSQDNYIELKQETICRGFNMFPREFTNAIKELVQYAVITKVVNRNKEHGNIYLVNPGICLKGKGIPNGIYEKATSETFLENFDLSKDKVCNVAYHTIEHGETYISYNSITVL